MKKILAIFAAAACLLAVSCEKTPIESTATVGMAGQWLVTVDGVDANGNLTMEDPFGKGEFLVFTFNTSENGTDKMLISDEGNFWEFRNVISVDLASKTFSANAAQNLLYDCTVTITDGKITPNGATTPSGQPADAIDFYLVFSDDDYVGNYWEKMHFHGYRYTGFDADGIFSM